MVALHDIILKVIKNKLKKIRITKTKKPRIYGAAKACFKNLEANIGKILPQNILKYSPEELRTFSISKQKASYLIALSNAVVEKTLEIEKLSQLTDDEIRNQLIKVKGIGNWTIDIYLMFCLQSKDIIPLGDIAVVNN